MELELRRRKESLCCLFSLSLNFFSELLFARNRCPVVSILTGEMDGVVVEDVGREKLSDDSACDGDRENRPEVDVCREVGTLCDEEVPGEADEMVDRRDGVVDTGVAGKPPPPPGSAASPLLALNRLW